MTHSLNDSLDDSPPDSLTDSLPDSLTDSLPDSLTDSHSHSLKGSDVRPGVPPVPWSTPILRGRYGTICTAKGSDVRPGVPLVVLGFRRFCVAASVICQGVGCSPWCPSGVPPSGVPPSGVPPSGVPPVSLRCPSPPKFLSSGVPPVLLTFRRFCVAGVGQRALPRVGCTPCPGVQCRFPKSGCRPWRPSGIPRVSLGFRFFSAAFAWQAWDNVQY